MTNTPKTDALREVIVGQYKEDELTGNGMGNILAALADVEELERERDKERELADRLAALVSKPASEWGWEKVDALTAWKEARND